MRIITIGKYKRCDISNGVKRVGTYGFRKGILLAGTRQECISRERYPSPILATPIRAINRRRRKEVARARDAQRSERGLNCEQSSSTYTRILEDRFQPSASG